MNLSPFGRRVVAAQPSESSVVENSNKKHRTRREPMPAWADANEKLLSGLEFFATRQLRVPIRVLLRDGELHTDLKSRPPRIATQLWHGIWTPKTKTWKELTGVDLPEAVTDTCASDIGPVSKSGDYLPFLIAVRTISESSGPTDERQKRILAELENPRWAEFVQQHGGASAVARRALDSSTPKRAPRKEAAPERVAE